ncbi:MAG: HAD-IA family hydrolase [Candidatus Acetothermia bacterium]|nr:HAD-IA family hydrolase [Candidatus Acetothermia bacterium]MDH7506139.1 HAD-IA family hydrolase [Candidatus Acetothermia bacterium]
MAEQILAYLPMQRPVAILCCGLPGSGKTWLAGLLRLQLAREPSSGGVEHLQTDRVRRELFPVRRYTPEETEAVYRELLRQAEAALKEGKSTILDGTFLMSRWRAEAYSLFRELRAPFITVLAVADERVVRARFARKPLFPDPSDFSEASFRVYLEMREKLSADPDYSLPNADRDVRVLVVDTERGEVYEPYPQPRLEGFYETLEGLEAVIFDMDGVIVRSEEAWLRSEREFLESQGIFIIFEEFQRRHAPYLAGRNQTEAARFYKETFGLSLPVEEIRRQRMAIVRRYFREVEPVLGAKELIATLFENGLKLGLASAAPLELIELVLRDHGLERYFQAVVSGDQLHEGKPNPMIYLLAARELGVEPERCLVFEDAPNGVRAAKAAGMSCAYLINPAVRWAGELIPDFVLEGFDQLDLARLGQARASRRRSLTKANE